jgi:hypothetical protein
MIRLSNSVHAWGTPAFSGTLKQEIEQLGADQLPLQQGLSVGNYATAGEFSVMVISASEEAGFIRVKAGVFFKGIIAGCNCADDPTPVEEHDEYCEVQFDINKTTAEATVALLNE